ncbi:putative membrane protein [Vulgatibacter incomptus]|uniref:Putative membrane protein n=2 Tax=Vulgatibacter incomptus TaxID=1391653 RepID=A0A0K1PGG8_9BACT|nr:putative membrane protein [Vulgatibacter incomptus]
MTEIAKLLTSTESVWVSCLFIVAVGVVPFLMMWGKLRSVRVDAEKGIGTLATADGKSAFRANYEDHDARFLENRVLGKTWREYRRTFEFPASLGGAAAPVRTPLEASAFFQAERLMADRLNLRRYGAVPNILTGLGILGTFVGLAAGIHLANLGINVADIEAMKSSLGDLLAGASMAFLTSICGLTCSMLFTLGERTLVANSGAAIERFAASLDDRLEFVTAEALAAKQLEESKEQTTQLKQFNDTLAIHIAEALDERVAGRLTPALDRLIEAVNGVRSDRGESNEKLLTSLVQEFQRTMSGAAGSEISAMAQTLERVQDVLENSLGAMQEAGHALTSPIAATTNRLEVSMAKLETAIGGWASLIEGTKQTLERFDSLTRAMDGVHGKFQNTALAVERAGENLKVTGDRLGAASDVTQTAAQSMGEASVQLATAVHATSASWADYQNRFADTDRSLAAAFQQLDEGLHRYSDQVKHFLLEIDEQFGKASKHLVQAVSTMGDDLGDLPVEVKKLTEQVDRIASGLQRRVG